jgi:hypothetical protein
MIQDNKMSFFVVYTKVRKKFDKYVKSNKIKNKYIIDVKRLSIEEEIDPDDKTYLKIVIFNKIQQAIEKGKDIYYIPNFDSDFCIDKLLNLKKILGQNDFNILLFYDEFSKSKTIIEPVLDNLSKFSNSQIIKDY